MTSGESVRMVDRLTTPLSQPDIQRESVSSECTRVSSWSPSTRNRTSVESLSDSESSNLKTSSQSPSKFPRELVCLEKKQKLPQSSESQSESKSSEISLPLAPSKSPKESSCLDDSYRLPLISEDQRESESYNNKSSSVSSHKCPRKSKFCENILSHRLSYSGTNGKKPLSNKSTSSSPLKNELNSSLLHRKSPRDSICSENSHRLSFLSEDQTGSGLSDNRSSSNSPSKSTKTTKLKVNSVSNRVTQCKKSISNEPNTSSPPLNSVLDSKRSDGRHSSLSPSKTPRESICDRSTLPLLSECQRESESCDDRYSSYSASTSPRKDSCSEGSSPGNILSSVTPESCKERDSEDTFPLPSDRELTREINQSLLYSSSNEDSDNSQQLNQLQPQTEAIYKLLRSLRPKYTIWKKINISPMAKEKKRKYHDVSSSESESPKRKKSKKNTEHSDNTIEGIGGRDFIDSYTEEGIKRKHKKSKNNSRDLENSRYEENSVEEEESCHKMKKSKKSSKPKEIEELSYGEKNKEKGEKMKKQKLPHMLSSEDELNISINENSESLRNQNNNSEMKSNERNKPAFSVQVEKNSGSFMSSGNKAIDQQSFTDDFRQLSSSIDTSRSFTKLKKSSGVEEEDSSIQGSGDESRESANDQIKQNMYTGTEKKSKDTEDDEDSSDQNGKESHSKSASVRNRNEMNPQKEKKYREHKFTDSDDEEVARFSSLLRGKVAKENNIWILQCPMDMDVSQLVNQEVNFNGVSKLNDKKNSYEAYSYKHDEPSVTTLAVPSHRNHFKVCNIPVTGNIIVSESVELPKESSFQLPVLPERVAFPTEELRPRHPLLGRCTSESSESVLHPNDSMNFSQTKKKKKKKHKAKDEEGENGCFLSNESLGFTLESEEHNESKRHKKKKKKRHSDDG